MCASILTYPAHTQQTTTKQLVNNVLYKKIIHPKIYAIDPENDCIIPDSLKNAPFVVHA